jgi:ATP-binding cassette subfamily B protein
MKAFDHALKLLGALDLDAQRLLPAMQQAYAAWSSLRGDHASLKDAIDLINTPLSEYSNQEPPRSIFFKKKLFVNAANYSYSGQSDWKFRDSSLTIPKGSRVGFIGTTGSCKSTLLDTVKSPLPLSQGTLEVDGQTITSVNKRSWQAHIVHVPQAIFLADSSIAENIAFGEPKDKILLSRLLFAAQQAQISEAIESWPQQYSTFVGERGIRLSGGQQQRIGIARAMYQQAEVIIFCEATSALDNETEEAVMQGIESLREEVAILIISHRISTLNNCDFFVELDKGHLRCNPSNSEKPQPKQELFL